MSQIKSREYIFLTRKFVMHRQPFVIVVEGWRKLKVTRVQVHYQKEDGGLGKRALGFPRFMYEFDLASIDHLTAVCFNRIYQVASWAEMLPIRVSCRGKPCSTHERTKPRLWGDMYETVYEDASPYGKKRSVATRRLHQDPCPNCPDWGKKTEYRGLKLLTST